jgi:hypothetical protein
MHEKTEPEMIIFVTRYMCTNCNQKGQPCFAIVQQETEHRQSFENLTNGEATPDLCVMSSGRVTDWKIITHEEFIWQYQKTMKQSSSDVNVVQKKEPQNRFAEIDFVD